jgi:ABC-type phosphate/phosphonate transport system substrate-binding protein
MKTTTVTTRLIANAIAGSSQRGAREYQRKPAFYLVPARAEKPMAPKGQSFREILERELGTSTALNASSADAETTQVLSGYWA